MNYWLMKSEPDAFSINDLYNKPNQTEHWDGVRNYQARNYDAGCYEVRRSGVLLSFQLRGAGYCRHYGSGQGRRYPDFSAFDPDDRHFDPNSDPVNPRWIMVDVKYVRTLSHIISLKELKLYPELADLALVKRGNRLSIMPVSKSQWDFILALE